jgi:serine/threonine protein kinase
VDAASDQLSWLPARYRYEDELGRTEGSQVLLVRDRQTGQQLALKTVIQGGQRARSELKAEYRFIADIVHPNLVELFELSLSDERVWFTMEYVDGLPFTEHEWRERRDGRLPLPATAIQLVDGIGALHDAGLVHRDLKPANVLVSPDGVVKILDAGLAADQRPLGENDDDDLVGTLAYLAPEVFLGKATAPSRDLFALGVMLYEAETGRLPYDGKSPLDFMKRSSGGYVPLLDASPTAAPALAELIEALLSPTPEARPPLAEVKRALLTLLDDATAPRLASRTTFVGRNREISVLAEAIDDVARGASRQLLLKAPSGYGKSALCVESLSRASDRRPVRILKSKCRLSERLPYQAIDGLIDALPGAFRRSGSDPPPLAPLDAAALCTIFPALEPLAPSPALEERDARPTASCVDAARRRSAICWRALPPRPPPSSGSMTCSGRMKTAGTSSPTSPRASCPSCCC